MVDFIYARIVHILSILLWIGGVAFVTMVVMPAIRRDSPPGERLAAFGRIEGGFAPQARVWVLLAGASGFWMAAMIAIWAIFSLMLFVLEPLVIHRRMQNSADPAADFARMERMHRILLAASLVTFGGAVGGSHGLW